MVTTRSTVRSRGASGARELRVDEEEPRPRVTEDVGDLAGVEPRVDRDQHTAREPHPEVGLEQRRHVGREERDPIAGAEPRRAQRRREPAHALAQLRVGEPAPPVDGRDPGAVDARRTLDQEQRRQLGPAHRHGPRP
jgi:hypothetical protein